MGKKDFFIGFFFDKMFDCRDFKDNQLLIISSETTSSVWRDMSAASYKAPIMILFFLAISTAPETNKTWFIDVISAQSVCH